MRRRDFLGAVGTAAAAGLAGCNGGPDPDEGRPRVPTEPNYRGWFDGVRNYSGTIDARDEDEVEVTVGAEGNTGYYASSPAAIAVSPGTSVRWTWTGRGGEHNVVSETGAFDSGAPVDREDEEFVQQIADPAVYRYVCEPHRRLGMRGAVFVALGEPET